MRNAQRKPHELHHCGVPGIEQRGVDAREIVIEIIHKRDKTENEQRPCRFLQQLRGGIGDIAQQQHKGQHRDENAHTVVYPLPVGQAQCRNAAPVADLTAQIGCQHRQHAMGKTVAINAVQKHDERQMHNERIELFCAVRAEQEKGCGIHSADGKRKAQQPQNVFAVHAHAEKGGGNIHAEQQCGGVVYNAEHGHDHGDTSPSRNISAK